MPSSRLDNIMNYLPFGQTHRTYHFGMAVIALYVARKVWKLDRRLGLAEKACAEGRAVVRIAKESQGYLDPKDLGDLSRALTAHWDSVRD